MINIQIIKEKLNKFIYNLLEFIFFNSEFYSKYYYEKAKKNFHYETCLNYLNKSIYKNPKNINSLELRINRILSHNSVLDHLNFAIILNDIFLYESIMGEKVEIYKFKGMAYYMNYHYKEYRYNHQIYKSNSRYENERIIINKNEKLLLLEKSKIEFLDFLRFNKIDIDAFRLLSYIFEIQGDFQNSEAYIQKIIQNADSSYILEFGFYVKIARIRSLQKKYVEAIEDLTMEIYQQFPQVCFDFKRLGFPDLVLDNYENLKHNEVKNIAYITEITLLTFKSLYLNRAECYYKINLINEAISDIEHFINLSPTFVQEKLKNSQINWDYHSLFTWIKKNSDEYYIDFISNA